MADPYFHGLANVDREPSTQPISKLEFEFERRKLAKDDVRELIYREVGLFSTIPFAFVMYFTTYANYNHLSRCCLERTDIRVPPTNASRVSSRWRAN